MKKEFKVNGKVTYPQGTTSRTTYTLIDSTGNMITYIKNLWRANCHGKNRRYSIYYSKI